MAPTASPKIKRALISVSNKEGLVELGSELVNDFGVEIISTGGTLKSLLEGGVQATDITELNAVKKFEPDACISVELVFM